MPIVVERANVQSLTQNMWILQHNAGANVAYISTYPQGRLLSASFLATILNLPDSDVYQERA